MPLTTSSSASTLQLSNEPCEQAQVLRSLLPWRDWDILETYPALSRVYLTMSLVVLRVSPRERALILSAVYATGLPRGVRELCSREQAAVQFVRCVRRGQAPPACVRKSFVKTCGEHRLAYVAAVAAFGALDAAIASLNELPPFHSHHTGKRSREEMAMNKWRMVRDDFLDAPCEAPALWKRVASPLKLLSKTRRAKTTEAAWISHVPSTDLELCRYVRRRLGFCPQYFRTGPISVRRALMLATNDLLLTEWGPVPVRVKHLMCYILARASGFGVLAAHAAFLAYMSGASLFQLLLAVDRRTLVVLRTNYLAKAPRIPSATSTISSDRTNYAKPEKRPRARERRAHTELGNASPRVDRVSSGMSANIFGNDIDANYTEYDCDYDSSVEEEISEVDRTETESDADGDAGSGDELEEIDLNEPPSVGVNVPVVDEIEEFPENIGDDLFGIEEDEDGIARLALKGAIFGEREVALLLFAHSVARNSRRDGLARASMDESSEMQRLFSAQGILEASSVIGYVHMLQQWTACFQHQANALETPVRRFVQSAIGTRLELANVGQRLPLGINDDYHGIPQGRRYAPSHRGGNRSMEW